MQAADRAVGGGGEREERRRGGRRKRRRRRPGRRCHVPGASPAVALSTGTLAPSPTPPYDTH